MQKDIENLKVEEETNLNQPRISSKKGDMIYITNPDASWKFNRVLTLDQR